MKTRYGLFEVGRFLSFHLYFSSSLVNLNLHDY